ncbi:MAG: CDP-alcohol phosphatidyltransferase family protein [Candidatus Niyogibacteria bacterium]|nr:CDP-alcohol phosphatidyltransferase family protein [Candidatus Niyogibacteria bacterium]
MTLSRGIPNGTTLIRLIGGPALAYLFSTSTDTHPTLFFASMTVWFLVLAGTDWLDGLLARWWEAQSRLGAILDPLADKALVWPFLYIFTFDTAFLNQWMLAPLGVLALLDAYSTLRRFVQRSAPETHLRANGFGKVKTFCCYLSVLCFMGVMSGFAFLYEFGLELAERDFDVLITSLRLGIAAAQIALVFAALFALLSLLRQGLRRIPTQN